jgi:hypothetical protein
LVNVGNVGVGANACDVSVLVENDDAAPASAPTNRTTSRTSVRTTTRRVAREDRGNIAPVLFYALLLARFIVAKALLRGG